MHTQQDEIEFDEIIWLAWLQSNVDAIPREVAPSLPLFFSERKVERTYSSCFDKV
jgi:hypothetical protein